MRISEVPVGSRVFIDANIFIHHLEQTQKIGLGKHCTTFLEAVGREELTGCTSVNAVEEVVHRTLPAEAIRKHHLPLRGLVPHLKRHHDLVLGLTEHLDVVKKITEMRVTILSVTLADLEASVDLRRRYGLLGNDSLMVAIMQSHGITHLATANGDFNRVAEIQVWNPLPQPPSPPPATSIPSP